MRRIEFIISDLFGYSAQTYFNWKKEIEKRPILKMIEKYFTKEELEEFLETGQIQKMENLNEYFLKKESLKLKYLNYFLTNFGSISRWDEQASIPFWFSMLVFIKHYGKKFDNFQSIAISFSLSKYSPINSVNKYEVIEAPMKRIIPTLKYLDSIDGMYSYIHSILSLDLADLSFVSSEKQQEEAKIHIDIFKEFENYINENIVAN